MNHYFFVFQRINKKIHQYLYVLFVIAIVSCSNTPDKVKRVIKMAGDNGKELQAVINHYQNKEDSLKLKAAYFLIENMDTKFSYDTLAIGHHRKFIKILDSLNSLPIDEKRKMKWWYDNTPLEEKYELDVWYLNGLNWHPDFKKSIWDSLNLKYGRLDIRSLPLVKDINVITSDLLIENIDLAFKVWQEKPWARHVGFEDFCEFILPYRVAHEPLNNWRANLYNKYSWIDSLYDGHKVLDVAKILNDSLQWFKNDDLFTQYPDLSLTDMFKAKSGICTDQNNLANYVLRSQGVPIIHVLKNKGTSWSAILDSDQNLVEFDGAFEAPNKNISYMEKHMLSESYKLSKVTAYSYAKTQYPFSELPKKDIPPFFQIMDIKDVTRLSQIDKKNISIQTEIHLDRDHDYVFLCQFKSDKLEAIDWSKPNKGRVTFQAIGTNKIYILAFYKNKNYIPIGYPFYLNKDGVVIHLKPDTGDKENVRLFRKYGMGFRETKYAKLMVGCKFQGANNKHFKNATNLFTIKDIPKYLKEKVININSKFKFIRFVSNPKSRIAEIGFYNSKNKKLLGKYLTKDETLLGDKVALAFDGNIKTNFSYDGLIDGWWIGMDLGKPTQINKISYLFQNSFNTIEPGHRYELFYWFDGWKSLGIKKAKHRYIDYKSPKNSALRLVDLTEGKDQMVFYVMNGKQIWG